MSRIKSPQEKRSLRLDRDRRNTFGENSKSSRKNIQAGKQRSHRDERRAVGLILGRLKESANEDDASAADDSTRTTIITKGRSAFRKTPDMPLGVVIKRKLARRHSSETTRNAHTGDGPGIYGKDAFDLPYVRSLHKRAIIFQLRRSIRPKGYGSQKKSAYLRTYERKEATRWREAILRDAPLLKGFLAEEPQWREKALQWCEKVLAT